MRSLPLVNNATPLPPSALVDVINVAVSDDRYDYKSTAQTEYIKGMSLLWTHRVRRESECDTRALTESQLNYDAEDETKMSSQTRQILTPPSCKIAEASNDTRPTASGVDHSSQSSSSLSSSCCCFASSVSSQSCSCVALPLSDSSSAQSASGSALPCARSRLILSAAISAIP